MVAVSYPRLVTHTAALYQMLNITAYLIIKHGLVVFAIVVIGDRSFGEFDCIELQRRVVHPQHLLTLASSQLANRSVLARVKTMSTYLNEIHQLILNVI